MNKQSGFTLIELVMVIVILGILAATALPKYVDLKTQAEASALQGVAGSISSASAVAYAGSEAGATGAVTVTTADTCQTAATAILQGGIPAGYTLDNTTKLVKGSNTCVVTQTATSNTTNTYIIVP